MAEQSETVVHEVDNLITAHKPLITMNTMQLTLGVVARGEVVKEDGSGGLVPLALAADIPYGIILQDADAALGAVDCVYTRECSVLASELTFGAGTIDDFRVSIAANTEIHLEEA